MGAEDGRRVSWEEVAALSTVKGWPHEEDWAVEMPMRERRVVRRRFECFMMGCCVCDLRDARAE